MDGSVRLESRIDHVVVYRRGARVTRSASLAGIGLSRPVCASIVGLPLAMDDGSVRVRVAAPDGVSTPIAREMRVTLEVGSVDPSLPPPEGPEVQAARRRVASLREEMTRLAQEQSSLRNLEPSPRPEGRRGESPRESPFESRMAFVAFVAERSAKLDSAIAAVRADLRVAQEELATYLAREAEASTSRQKRREELTKSVVVELEGGDSDDASLRVSYVVPGARWCPTYSLHLSAGFASSRLGVRATVFQATGEDWRGVQMLLSTAEPQRWHELPTLSSLRIGKRQSRPAVRGFRAPPAGTEELFVAYDEKRSELEALEHLANVLPLGGLGNEGMADGRARAEPYLSSARDDDEVTAVNRPEPVSRSSGLGGRTAAPMQLDEAAAPHGQSAPESAAPTNLFQSMSITTVRQPLHGGMRARLAPPPARAKGGGLLSGIGDFFGSGGGGGAELDEQFEGAADVAPQGAPMQSLANLRRDPPVSKAVDEPLLAFGTLRMAGADDPERGTLVVVETRERHVEEIVRTRSTATRESVLVVVDAALEESSRRATEIAERALPPRCAEPGSTSGFDYAYPAATPVDVPSDGSFHSVPLAEQETATQLRHVVVPRESTEVYRVVELDNPIDAPLLDGPVDVYLGGRYLITGDLHDVPAGGRLTLGIGAEQRVKVARNCRYSEETEGLMRGTLALKHDIAIEISSHLEEPCELEVRERVPTTVENDDDVRVDVGKVEPSWEPWDPKLDGGPALRGGYRWRLTLPRGEKRTLSASYTIRTSSKNELAGGNRRET